MKISLCVFALAAASVVRGQDACDVSDETLDAMEGGHGGARCTYVQAWLANTDCTSATTPEIFDAMQAGYAANCEAGSAPACDVSDAVMDAIPDAQKCDYVAAWLANDDCTSTTTPEIFDAMQKAHHDNCEDDDDGDDEDDDDGDDEKSTCATAKGAHKQAIDDGNCRCVVKGDKADASGLWAPDGGGAHMMVAPSSGADDTAAPTTAASVTSVSPAASAGLPSFTMMVMAVLGVCALLF